MAGVMTCIIGGSLLAVLIIGSCVYIGADKDEYYDTANKIDTIEEEDEFV